MKNEANHITRLLTISLLDHTSLNILFPLFTFIFFDKDSSLFSVVSSHAARSILYGLCISLTNIGTIISALLFSTISDYYGRKSLLLISACGALIYGLTGALGILLGSIGLILIGRLIGSFCSCINPIACAVIGDISSKDNKIVYMGYLQFIIAMSAFIGPTLGGFFAKRFFFAELNFSFPFLIAIIIAVTSAILTIFYFKETLPQKKLKLSSYRYALHDFKKTLLQPSVLRISLLMILTQFSWSMYYQFMPPLLKRHFIFSTSQVGLFVGLIAIWLAFAAVFGIRRLQKLYSAKHMIIYSSYCSLIGFLITLLAIFLFPTSIANIAIWITAIPIAMSEAIASCAIKTLYSDAVDKTAQGKVMAICFVTLSLIWALTGLCGGFLGTIDEVVPLVIAPLGICLLLIFLFLENSFLGNHRVLTSLLE